MNKTEKKTENVTMDLLIDKSIEIFATKGYSAAKLTDITNSLSISRGPIYYYFKDKYGLYNAAFNRFEDGLRTIHSAVFSKELPLMEKMEIMIFEFVKHISVFGHHFFFGIDEIPELHDINLRYQTMNRELYEDKLHMVEQAQAEGLLKKELPPKAIVDYVYLVYFAMLEGINSGILQGYSDKELKGWIHIQFKGLLLEIL